MMAEYIDKSTAWNEGVLQDWYINSVDDAPPVWTEEHISELCEDFLVIPKDTPTADARPERHGVWLDSESPLTSSCKCSLCNRYFESETPYCPQCGAKMDWGVADAK